MRFRMDRERPRPASIDAARRTLIGSLALLAVGVALYAIFAPSVDAVALQVAGTARRANEVIGGRVHDVRAALWWDFVLIAGYASGLAMICRLGRHVFWTRPLSWAAVAGAGLAVAAGAFNVPADRAALIWPLRRAVARGWARMGISGLFCVRGTSRPGATPTP